MLNVGGKEGYFLFFIEFLGFSIEFDISLLFGLFLCENTGWVLRR